MPLTIVIGGNLFLFHFILQNEGLKQVYSAFKRTKNKGNKFILSCFPVENQCLSFNKGLILLLVKEILPPFYSLITTNI